MKDLLLGIDTKIDSFDEMETRFFSKNKEIFIQNFNNWLISLGL